MRFDFVLTPGDGEMPSDFASRLARRACRDHLRDFCLDFELDCQGIVDGVETAVAGLATLARINVELLLQEAFVRVPGTRRYLHKGQEFVRQNLVRERVRICPMCFAEDLERRSCRMSARPHRRNEWIVESIRTCAVHDVALVDICAKSAPGHSHDTQKMIADALPRMPDYLDSARRRTPSAFETYARSRMVGGSASPWLDALPFHAALRLVGVVGAVDAYGPKVMLRSLTDDERRECEAAGFGILDRGEEGVRELLERLQQKFVVGRAAWGPKAMYGRLYEWLAHESDDPAYEPMRLLMLKHAAETLPVGPEDAMFGRPFDRRRLHSVRTAALEFGVHQKRLRKIFVAQRLIGPETAGLSNDRLLVDADRATKFVAMLADSMTLKEAATYLHVPRPLELALVANGFLRPTVRGGTDTLKNHVFVRSDLDAFVAALEAKIDPSLNVGSRSVEIPKAAHLACCSSLMILQLLLDGTLKRNSKNANRGGFLSVLVDVDEVRSHVTGPEHGGTILRDVEKYLGTTSIVVANLIRHGFLGADQVINPVMKRPQTVVFPDKLARFRAEYVTLNSLAKARGVHLVRLKKDLTAAGVTPVADPAELKVTLYRRVDIL